MNAQPLTAERAVPEPSSMVENLDEIRADIFARLSEAASDRRSPIHMPVVGTQDGDLRMMVLRAFDPDSSTLRFHTDARAPKCGVIGDGSPVSVLGFDPEDHVQLRLRGSGRIEQAGAVADAAWAESTNFARRCYLGEGPGADSDAPTSGLPEEYEGIEPSDADLVPARANFAVLLVELSSLDWFCLAHTGHRRAHFSREGSSWNGRWLAP